MEEFFGRYPELFSDWLPQLLGGMLVTLELVALSMAFGLLLAVPLALARVSPRPWLRVPAYLYILLFRGTPLLVQIFVIYYGLGQFESVRESILWPYLREAWVCAILAFSLNTAAYVGEILRGGIEAVPRGEKEAAVALGMGAWLRYRRIILPRAFRLTLPALSNEAVLLLKASVLASTITIMDLMGVTRLANARTYASIQVFTIAGAIYLILAVIIARLFRLVERRANRYLQRTN
jgi:putative lysine/arginine/ornithine/histidine/octopine transport system permease protein